MRAFPNTPSRSHDYDNAGIDVYSNLALHPRSPLRIKGYAAPTPAGVPGNVGVGAGGKNQRSPEALPSQESVFRTTARSKGGSKKKKTGGFGVGEVSELDWEGLGERRREARGVERQPSVSSSSRREKSRGFLQEIEEGSWDNFRGEIAGRGYGEEDLEDKENMGSGMTGDFFGKQWGTDMSSARGNGRIHQHQQRQQQWNSGNANGDGFNVHPNNRRNWRQQNYNHNNNNIANVNNNNSWGSLGFQDYSSNYGGNNDNGFGANFQNKRGGYHHQNQRQNANFLPRGGHHGNNSGMGFNNNGGGHQNQRTQYGDGGFEQHGQQGMGMGMGRQHHQHQLNHHNYQQNSDFTGGRQNQPYQHPHHRKNHYSFNPSVKNRHHNNHYQNPNFVQRQNVPWNTAEEDTLPQPDIRKRLASKEFDGPGGEERSKRVKLEIMGAASGEGKVGDDMVIDGDGKEASEHGRGNGKEEGPVLAPAQPPASSPTPVPELQAPPQPTSSPPQLLQPTPQTFTLNPAIEEFVPRTLPAEEISQPTAQEKSNIASVQRPPSSTSTSTSTVTAKTPPQHQTPPRRESPKSSPPDASAATLQLLRFKAMLSIKKNNVLEKAKGDNAADTGKKTAEAEKTPTKTKPSIPVGRLIMPGEQASTNDKHLPPPPPPPETSPVLVEGATSSVTSRLPSTSEKRVKDAEIGANSNPTSTGEKATGKVDISNGNGNGGEKKKKSGEQSEKANGNETLAAKKSATTGNETTATTSTTNTAGPATSNSSVSFQISPKKVALLEPPKKQPRISFVDQLFPESRAAAQATATKVEKNTAPVPAKSTTTTTAAPSTTVSLKTAVKATNVSIATDKGTDSKNTAPKSLSSKPPPAKQTASTSVTKPPPATTASTATPMSISATTIKTSSSPSLKRPGSPLPAPPVKKAATASLKAPSTITDDSNRTCGNTPTAASTPAPAANGKISNSITTVAKNADRNAEASTAQASSQSSSTAATTHTRSTTTTTTSTSTTARERDRSRDPKPRPSTPFTLPARPTSATTVSSGSLASPRRRARREREREREREQERDRERDRLDRLDRERARERPSPRGSRMIDRERSLTPPVRANFLRTDANKHDKKLMKETEKLVYYDQEDDEEDLDTVTMSMEDYELWRKDGVVR